MFWLLLSACGVENNIRDLTPPPKDTGTPPPSGQDAPELQMAAKCPMFDFSVLVPVESPDENLDEELLADIRTGVGTTATTILSEKLPELLARHDYTVEDLQTGQLNVPAIVIVDQAAPFAESTNNEYLVALAFGDDVESAKVYLASALNQSAFAELASTNQADIVYTYVKVDFAGGTGREVYTTCGVYSQGVPTVITMKAEQNALGDYAVIVYDADSPAGDMVSIELAESDGASTLQTMEGIALDVAKTTTTIAEQSTDTATSISNTFALSGVAAEDASTLDTGTAATPVLSEDDMSTEDITAEDSCTDSVSTSASDAPEDALAE